MVVDLSRDAEGKKEAGGTHFSKGISLDSTLESRETSLGGGLQLSSFKSGSNARVFTDEMSKIEDGSGRGREDI